MSESTLVERLAVIDIGTNSVLLTIAERGDDGSIHTLAEEAEITRIGEGLGLRQEFLSSAIERTARVLQHYKKRCTEFDVNKILIVGTAAFRRAANAYEAVGQFKEKLDLDIEIISGEREAELSYKAAAHDFGSDLLVIDIGGGSTEFIWPAKSNGGSKLNLLSLPLGSVVLHERYVKSDPISEKDYQFLQSYILSELLASHGSQWGGGAGLLLDQIPERLVALAGTATTLAAMHLKLETYSHDQVHGTELSFDQLTKMLNITKAASIEERKKIPGIEPKRADVVLEGALILHETMQAFDYDRVTISDRGVRWGLIYEQLT